jgi:hypothetical protein
MIALEGNIFFRPRRAPVVCKNDLVIENKMLSLNHILLNDFRYQTIVCLQEKCILYVLNLFHDRLTVNMNTLMELLSVLK